jgi:hypothetical protein
MDRILFVLILSSAIAFGGVSRKPNTTENTKPSPVRASAAKVKKTAKSNSTTQDEVKAKE